MATPIVDMPRLPARPLVEKIDRMLAYASPGRGTRITDNTSNDRAAMYEQLGTSTRRLYEWRKPGAQVQADVADRVLSGTPYLWFDVWLECPRDAEHEVAVMDTGSCARCVAYERARFAFTGQRPGKGKRKRKDRP
jgi:hypothetical protein